MMKIFNHISTILKHKWFVYVYCKEMGITWRGIKHDLSKFHPTEFLESLKYYQKGSSPIPRCKKDKGYSNAWFHHRGHNDHHYEYWVDNLDNGGVSVKMPYDAMLEMEARQAARPSSSRNLHLPCSLPAPLKRDAITEIREDREKGYHLPVLR